MAVADAAQLALEGLIAQLEAHLPTALTDLAGGGGPTLDVPLVWETLALEDLDRVERFPHCGIAVDGEDVEVRDRMTPQRDLFVEIVAAVTFEPNTLTVLEANKAARYYARALDVTLTRRARFVTGIGRSIQITRAAGQRQIGATRNRRRGFCRARFRYRTTREE